MAADHQPETVDSDTGDQPAKDPVLLSLTAACLAGVTIMIASLYFLTQDYLERSVIQVAARYNEAVQEFRTIYTSEVVARLVLQGIEASHDYELYPQKIPLPANLSMELGDRLGALGTGARMRLYSAYPFPWREDGGPHDSFEKDALASLEANPNQPYYRFEGRGSFRVLRYATADLMRAACINCHNTHPDSPKTNWKVGDVRGVLEVTLPATSTVGGKLSSLNTAFIAAGVLMISGIILAVRLVAKQRHQADVLAKHTAALEKEVSERRQAETQLRRSNRDLLEFAHVASHDLNEPLRKVSAFGDLLQDECGNRLGDEGRLYLRKMIDASDRMRRLIDGLLAYSRISRNEAPKSSLDLKALADSVVDDLSDLIATTEANVIIGSLPEINANETQIRQLFQNLIANSLKFHREGVAPIVHVDGEILGKGLPDHLHDTHFPLGDAVCKITVSDNGIGFSEKYRDRIFEIFERLHSKQEYDGTGIGLAVCRKVVEAHHGTIHVHSTIGVGSMFEIYLPVNQDGTGKGNANVSHS